jgi:hypothetical protein
MLSGRAGKSKDFFYLRRKIMRYLMLSLLLVVLFSAAAAQTREQVMAEYETLKQRAEQLENMILQPGKEDTNAARLENAEVFRILPRGKYAEHLFNRGGGAFYSFTKRSHSYNQTPQITLEQNQFGVGFAGADYGFISDLGEIPLSEINRESSGVRYLAEYQPPTEDAKARAENSKIRNGLEVEGQIYKRRVPAIIGHSYVLRAISFDEADVLVAFKVHRQDADGSLIIFWKLIQNFEKPLLARNQ